MGEIQLIKTIIEEFFAHITKIEFDKDLRDDILKEYAEGRIPTHIFNGKTGQVSKIEDGAKNRVNDSIAILHDLSFVQIYKENHACFKNLYDDRVIIYMVRTKQGWRFLKNDRY